MFELKKKQFVGQVDCNIIMVDSLGDGLRQEGLYYTYNKV